ncbi:ribosomal protein S18-alanine N-acetyltransferase [Enterococcus sp. AZ109]|uniref:ribosomal protein S18-alanine N-acetyltransferase n=1 Tax=Enterococcus sp. AZ109 TaxID=2774634 RepID=UPI003F26F08E
MMKDVPLNQKAQQLWQINNAAYPTGSPWSVEEFYQDLQQKHSHYLLEEETSPVAFLGFHQVVDEIEITNVATLPEYKCQGLGKKLFERLLAHARKQDINQIFLEVRASNVAARNLYEQMHFQVIGKRKNYYHAPVEDALIMNLKVGNSHGNE